MKGFKITPHLINDVLKGIYIDGHIATKHCHFVGGAVSMTYNLMSCKARLLSSLSWGAVRLKGVTKYDTKLLTTLLATLDEYLKKHQINS
jgi:hypothetical protein